MVTTTNADRHVRDFGNLQIRLQSVRDASDCSSWVRQYMEWSGMEPSVPSPATQPTAPVTRLPLFERMLV